MEIPKHVGIIMDGNRRVAEEMGLPKYEGHKLGQKRIEPTVVFASEQGIEYLTLWAYSTKNQKRPKIEQFALNQVFRETLKSEAMDRLVSQGIKVSFIGDLSYFPQDIQRGAQKVASRSEQNTGMNLIVALNYSGRDEIQRSMKKAREAGHAEPEEHIEEYLDTVGIPNPDLIIRTGGDVRTSGFMSWQAEDAEWHFTDVKWPNFTENDFQRALTDFSDRKRNFGA